jgi:hypothetical protein
MHRTLDYLGEEENHGELKKKAYRILNDEFNHWREIHFPNTPPPQKKAKRNIFKRGITSSQSEFQFEDSELETYFRIPPVDETSFTNVLDWWRQHENSFPILSQFAAKYLVLSSSSASIERAWSQAKNITDTKRSNLSPKHIEETLYVKFNENYIQ